MHQWLVEHIANALEHTAAAERRALDATDPELQLDNERIAVSCACSAAVSISSNALRSSRSIHAGVEIFSNQRRRMEKIRPCECAG